MENKNYENLIKIFQENNCILENEDELDLKKQLKIKPIEIYIISIFMHKKIKNQNFSYKCIRDFIKYNIRIRDNIKKWITAIEEGIWNLYFNFLRNQNKEIDLEQFIKNRKCEFINKNKIVNLNFIINDLHKNKQIENEDYKNFQKVRKIRNLVSHQSYLLIFNQFEYLIKELKELKYISFIDLEIENDLIKILQICHKGLKYLNIFFKNLVLNTIKKYYIEEEKNEISRKI